MHKAAVVVLLGTSLPDKNTVTLSCFAIKYASCAKFFSRLKLVVHSWLLSCCRCYSEETSSSSESAPGKVDEASVFIIVFAGSPSIPC